MRTSLLLPRYTALLRTGLLTVLVPMSMLLMLGALRFALGLFAGYLLAMALYGLLHLFFQHGAPWVARAWQGHGTRNIAMRLRTLLSCVSRMIALGVLFTIFLRFFGLDALSILGGYLLTQIALTIFLHRCREDRFTGDPRNAPKQAA